MQNLIATIFLAIVFFFRFKETNAQVTIVANYSSELTTADPNYARHGGGGPSGFYYEAIEIIVNETGTYTIKSVSDIDTVGYLYQETFDPANPATNLLTWDDDNAGNRQFRLSAHLVAGVRYIVVVSTLGQSITGPFSVLVEGEGEVELNQIIVEATTSTTTTTTLPTIEYTGALTSTSPNYTRIGGTGSGYYYHVFDIRVPSTGTYVFSTSSSISDTYGYLYQGNFYPSHAQYNIIASDDDGSGNNQFKLTATLRSDLLYKLVFTTYTPGATGSFRIVQSGPI